MLSYVEMYERNKMMNDERTSEVCFNPLKGRDVSWLHLAIQV